MLNSQPQIKLAAQAASGGGSRAGGIHKSPLSLGPAWQGSGESWSSCLHHQKLLLSQSSAHFLGLPGGQLNMIISRATPAAPLVPAVTPQPGGPGGSLGQGRARGSCQHPGRGNSAILPLCPSWEHPLRAQGHRDTPTPRWRHPDPEPRPAPRARGRRHRALVATELLTRGHTFGSCSILCLSHSSPSSSSPFKALRLRSTETISWPRPRIWLLGCAGSWALSGCQRCQEAFLAIPPRCSARAGPGAGPGAGSGAGGVPGRASPAPTPCQGQEHPAAPGAAPQP